MNKKEYTLQYRIKRQNSLSLYIIIILMTIVAIGSFVRSNSYETMYLAEKSKKDSLETQNKKLVKENDSLRKISSPEFSKPMLAEYLKKLKVKYKDIVIAQAKLESGGFSSPIFKENNNLFGMKMAEKRPTVAIGVNRKHAVYHDWLFSVIDYAMLQSKILSKAKSREQYLAYLDDNYSELPKGEYRKLIEKNIE